MVGTLADPVRLWPYSRIVNVHWRTEGISAFIDFKLGLLATYFMDGQSCDTEQEIPAGTSVDENSLHFNGYTYVGGLPTTVHSNSFGGGELPGTISGLPSLPTFEFPIWTLLNADGYTDPSGLPGQQIVTGLTFDIFNDCATYHGTYCSRRIGGPHNGQLRTLGTLFEAGGSITGLRTCEYTVDLSSVTASVVVGMDTLNFVAESIRLSFRPDQLSSSPPFSSEEAFTEVRLHLRQVP